MLTGSNNKSLNYLGVNSELIFFYQRWQEALEFKTLDMYQYNILNTCVACLELYDVIVKTLDGLLTARQNVDDIKFETLDILKRDDILLKYNKPLLITLLRIIASKLESKKGDEIDDKNSSFNTSLRRLKYQLEAPLKLLHINYLCYIIEELQIDILNKNKNLSEKHMLSLISQCIYEGWSSKGLFMLSKYFEGAKSFNDKWTLFSQKILSNQIDLFVVYYSIKIETHKGITPESVRQTIKELGINLKKGTDIISGQPELVYLNSMIDSDKYYSIVSLHATDSNSAVLATINVLNNQLNIATFYNVVNPWIAYSPQIIVFNSESGTSESFKITDVFKTYDYIDSSNNVFDDTKNIFNNPNNIEIINKLHSAFSYTNLSRASSFQETKYISLWIAIESIMNTGQYSDIISHVKKVLPSALCIRYIYRIIRNFVEDCIRCGIKSLNSPININMESLNKKNLVSSMISVFRNDAHYLVLLDRCQTNELLSYRCEEIKTLLNNPKNILNKLLHYKTKIEWHIQRLYRIRNIITHSAFKDDKSLIIYIEHLYTYLSQLISEIVFYIEHKNASSIEEVYAIIGDNFETFKELLTEDTFDINDLLSDGVIDTII